MATDERYLQSFYAPDDSISLSLEYAHPNCGFGHRRNLGVGKTEAPELAELAELADGRRFFRCPADLPVSLLVKFLRCKYDVMDATTHKLEIFYNGHPLAPEYKLSDVAYIFSWKEKEPLRLWYRIGTAADEVKVEAVKVVESPRVKVKEVKEVKVTRDSLVDITDRWSSNQKELRSKTTPKRRKRMNVKPEPLDVVLVDKVKEVKEVKEVEDKMLLQVLSEEAMFDSSHPAEFCCSTPIPALPAGSGVESGDEVERSIKNWLPKAVFDLDDKALFAKRLLRETIIPSGRKLPDQLAADDDDNKVAAVKRKLVHEVVDVSKAEDEEGEASGRNCAASPDDNLMNPLRICVSADEEEEVHDSIGALDLSGRSDSDSSPRSGSLPAAPVAVSASPGRNCAGPHPYFMTPSALYTSLELLKRPAESASARKHPPGSKLCWSDLFSPSSVQPAHHQPPANHLLDFNKYK